MIGESAETIFKCFFKAFILRFYFDDLYSRSFGGSKSNAVIINTFFVRTFNLDTLAL